MKLVCTPTTNKRGKMLLKINKDNEHLKAYYEAKGSGSSTKPLQTKAIYRNPNAQRDDTKPFPIKAPHRPVSGKELTDVQDSYVTKPSHSKADYRKLVKLEQLPKATISNSPRRDGNFIITIPPISVPEEILNKTGTNANRSFHAEVTPMLYILPWRTQWPQIDRQITDTANPRLKPHDPGDHRESISNGTLCTVQITLVNCALCKVHL